MSDKPGNSEAGAGLTYAPPYNKSSEFDPNKAEVINAPPEALGREDFDFFRRRMEKQATMGRILLILLILGGLSANLWATLTSQNAVIDNIDQARHDQAALDEHMANQVSVLSDQIAVLQRELADVNAVHKAVAEN